jgi:putative transposase
MDGAVGRQKKALGDRAKKTESITRCKQAEDYRRICSMRKPRVLREGARYHVMARINRREMILGSRPAKNLFLEVVKEAKRRYDFQIENFCVMSNHFHFIIRPARCECLSAIMQWILSVFAMRYNRIMCISGHVWGERFSSRIQETFQEFLQTFDYIDMAPIRANQVQDSRDWRYGGLWHHRHGIRDIVADMDERMRIFFPEHSFQLSH